MNPRSIRLRRKHDARVKAGHPWVFSNEIADDVAALPSGGSVNLLDARGTFVGRGYSNPRSLIAVRLLTRRESDDIDSPAFFVDRLKEAKAFRAAVYPDRRSLRLVHAEADGLPGLVLDRYDDVLCAQITTLGMETRRDALRQAIEEVFRPRGVVLRAEGRMRELEGLPDERAVWFGEVPGSVDIDELGVRFRVDLLGGQKTGHFYDQAENRRHAAQLCAGRSVLDVFCNTGGFSLYALRAGAREAVGIDASTEAVERAGINAAQNGVDSRFRAECGDAARTLERLVREERRFGVVMLDPPAFAKTRKVAARALVAYRDLNALGLCLLEDEGFLVTSSCSYHIEEDRFLEAIRHAAARAGRRLRLVRRGEQAPDHPVAPSIPESRYLKHLVFHVRHE